MDIKELSQQMTSIFDNNLVSLILYGSKACGEHTNGYSDNNVLAVLKRISPTELQKANKVVRKWTKKGNPPILFFDEEHIKTSTDVFPIEFLDIIRCHQLLHGMDPFEGVTIDKKNLRHECESELKGKLLKLRSSFVVNSHDKKATLRLMLTSISSFAAIFKGVISLLGEEPAPTKKELFEQLTKFIDFNPSIFIEILSVRSGDHLFRGDAEILEKFEQYLTEITTITRFVDRFN